MATRALARISEMGIQKYTFGMQMGVQFFFIPQKMDIRDVQNQQSGVQMTPGHPSG